MIKKQSFNNNQPMNLNLQLPIEVLGRLTAPKNIKETKLSKLLLFLSCIVFSYIDVLSMVNSHIYDLNTLIGFSNHTYNFIAFWLCISILLYFVVYLAAKLLIKWMIKSGVFLEFVFNRLTNVFCFWIGFRLLVVGLLSFGMLFLPVISNWIILLTVVITFLAVYLFYLDVKNNISGKLAYPFVFKALMKFAFYYNFAYLIFKILETL